MIMNNQKGFNLMELIVVVAIIGIIATVAIPSYEKNVTKSARSEGTTALLDIMRAQENFFANDFTYTTNLTDMSYSDPQVTESGRYSIRASVCEVGIALTTCIKLTASAQNGQADDGDLTLDSLGNRTHNGDAGWLK
mgnify:FL=1